MDAADILGAAPRTEFRARVRHSHAAQDVAGNKLTGLKKEVFDLTGKDVGANKPETPVQAFGKKHTQLKRKVHWEFTGFSNSARTDGLHLRHWQVLDKRLLLRASAARCGIYRPGWRLNSPRGMCDLSQKKGIKWEDYPFARFNKKVQLLSYNDDEYEQLLRSEQWTRKQTASRERERERERLDATPGPRAGPSMLTLYVCNAGCTYAAGAAVSPQLHPGAGSLGGAGVGGGSERSIL